jgi:hypothetical protein
MEETNPTESSGLPESSELLSPEQTEALEKAYALDVAKGGCKSCQSDWKPTRRDLIKTAFGAALVAGALLESNTKAQAIPVGPVDPDACRLRLEYCQAMVEGRAEYCRANCPPKSDGPEGAAHWICIFGCQGAYTGGLAQCLIDKAECDIAAAAAAAAAALLVALKWMEDNIAVVVIGTVIVVGTIALIVVCNGAAPACLAIASEAAAYVAPLVVRL